MTNTTNVTKQLHKDPNVTITMPGEDIKPEPKTKTPKATKPEPKVKEVKPKVDIKPLLTAMPEAFTPALLDKLFNLNDGGKTVRRHLRKHFTEPVKHEHKEKWSFTTADAHEILQYFADRYEYDLKNLEKEEKAY